MNRERRALRAGDAIRHVRPVPWRVIGAAAILILAIALIAGCGGGSNSSGVAKADDAATTTGTSTSQTTTSADAEQAQLDFAKCMRQQGLDFPDPQPDANGNLQFQAPGGGNIDQAAFQKGAEACQQYLQGAGATLSDADQTALQDAQLEFSQCMRKEGIDVPDPQQGQQGPGAGAQLDTNDPATAAALDKCQSIIQDALPNQAGGQ